MMKTQTSSGENMTETTFQLTQKQIDDTKNSAFFCVLAVGLIIAIVVSVCSWGQGRNDGQKFGAKLVQAQAVQRGYGAYYLGKDSVEPVFAWNEPAPEKPTPEKPVPEKPKIKGTLISENRSMGSK